MSESMRECESKHTSGRRENRATQVNSDRRRPFRMQRMQVSHILQRL